MKDQKTFQFGHDPSVGTNTRVIINENLQQIDAEGLNQWWSEKKKKMYAADPEWEKQWDAPSLNPLLLGGKILAWGDKHKMASDPADNPHIPPDEQARLFFDAAVEKATANGWPRMRFTGEPGACKIWEEMARERGLSLPVEITPNGGETVHIPPGGGVKTEEASQEMEEEEETVGPGM